MLVNACFALLTLWMVAITPLLASAGVAGVTIALAAKDTLVNFFGGMSLFLDQQFKKGDFVVLGTGEPGAISEVGLSSTRIISKDNISICIPDSRITNSKIINESAPEPQQTFRIKVGSAYGSDLYDVENALLTVASSEKMVRPAPEPRVGFSASGDSSHEYELLCGVGLDPSGKEGWQGTNLIKQFTICLIPKASFSCFRNVKYMLELGRGVKSPFGMTAKICLTCGPGTHL